MSGHECCSFPSWLLLTMYLLLDVLLLCTGIVLSVWCWGARTRCGRTPLYLFVQGGHKCATGSFGWFALHTACWDSWAGLGGLVGGCQCWGCLACPPVGGTKVLLQGIATPLALLPPIPRFLLSLHRRNLLLVCCRLQRCLLLPACWCWVVSVALLVQCGRCVLACKFCGGVCLLLLLWFGCRTLHQRLLLTVFPLQLLGLMVWKHLLWRLCCWWLMGYCHGVHLQNVDNHS